MRSYMENLKQHIISMLVLEYIMKIFYYIHTFLMVLCHHLDLFSLPGKYEVKHANYRNMMNDDMGRQSHVTNTKSRLNVHR